jgi:hypothetical protein
MQSFAAHVVVCDGSQRDPFTATFRHPEGASLPWFLPKKPLFTVRFQMQKNMQRDNLTFG